LAANSLWLVQMSQGLIAVQVTLCTVLLGGALLAVRSLHNLRTLDAGFDRDHVVVFAFDLSTVRYTPQHARRLEQRLLERTRALAGVQVAAFAGRGLMRGAGVKATITHVGQKATRADNLNTSLHSISPGYFETMGIKLLAGREYRKPRGTASPIVIPGCDTRTNVRSRPVTAGDRFGKALGTFAANSRSLYTWHSTEGMGAVL
jgi:hypothetical protein